MIKFKEIQRKASILLYFLRSLTPYQTRHTFVRLLTLKISKWSAKSLLLPHARNYWVILGQKRPYVW